MLGAGAGAGLDEVGAAVGEAGGGLLCFHIAQVTKEWIKEWGQWAEPCFQHGGSGPGVDGFFCHFGRWFLGGWWRGRLWKVDGFEQGAFFGSQRCGGEAGFDGLSFVGPSIGEQDGSVDDLPSGRKLGPWHGVLFEQGGGLLVAALAEFGEGGQHSG